MQQDPLPNNQGFAHKDAAKRIHRSSAGAEAASCTQQSRPAPALVWLNACGRRRGVAVGSSRRARNKGLMIDLIADSTVPEPEMA